MQGMRHIHGKRSLGSGGGPRDGVQAGEVERAGQRGDNILHKAHNDSGYRRA